VRVVFRIFIERHLQMKTLLGAVSVIALCLSPVMAGEGNLSDQSLARMGLAGMKNLSDSQGMQVRGLSAQAGGWSSTTLIAVGGTTGTTNYAYAGDQHSASTANLSVSGALTSTSSNYGSHTYVNIIAAGGLSNAHSH
jgi:hypothetical protein